MLKRTLILCFVMSASLLFGQLDSNSVTVTASRGTSVQPDQVLFAVYVTTGLGASLDEVLAALKGSGITSANFSGVSNAAGSALCLVTGTPAPAPTVQWAFGLPVPFSKMKDTVTALTGLQHSIGQANAGFTLSFSVQGAQVSPALQQSQTCNISDLISDANAQAQKLANAAGLTLGAILAMSAVTSSPAVNNSVPVAVLGSFASSELTVPQSCALTVKFSLTRF